MARRDASGSAARPDDRWGRKARAWIRDLYVLPPRVQALVDAELQRADILGAWIGLAVAAFLGLLYLISPKPDDAMGPIQAVPAVVALFLLLSGVRLRLAYRAPLSRTAQMVFIVADVALLYALIWSFHLQYDQPAAFYLKAPTFLFVFLLIAVRTLRFEPVAIIAIGLTAAMGWAGMTLYALYATPGPAVTRDFRAYITGNLVLVGAEVEKVVSILLVTGVLTLAIVIGRRALVLAASGATARDDLSLFFAPEVAARITAEDNLLRPGFGEIRRGAVLVSDIRGFTTLAAKRTPAEVMRLLVEYQQMISRVVSEHNGAIDKFLGDGVLATFGCARHSPNAAIEALRALLALMREARAFSVQMSASLGEPVTLGFAVVGGDILCGTVGDAARLEFTVVGDAVNLAAKLEKANKHLGTIALVDAATLDEARRSGFDDAVDGAHEYQIDLSDGNEPRVAIGWRA